jgi:hypothetical protein
MMEVAVSKMLDTLEVELEQGQSLRAWQTTYWVAKVCSNESFTCTILNPPMCRSKYVIVDDDLTRVEPDNVTDLVLF